MCDLLGDAAWVRISMDSGESQLYGFLRNVPQTAFFKVVRNIETLVRYRRKSIIGIGYVVQKENYRNIYEAAKFFKGLGVDNIRISAAFTPMGYEYFSDFQQEARDQAKRAESLSDDHFTVFNLFNDRVRDCFEGTQDYSFCPIKDLLTYIGADFNVYTCCTLAYNKKGLIGSIKDQSFKDLWQSKEKQEMFAGHSPMHLCKFPCMYRNKNEFINYCIKKDPRHINFI
jgi:MoaA/NifB/PqqE/SkfB family radical SAM enzyme